MARNARTAPGGSRRSRAVLGWFAAGLLTACTALAPDVETDGSSGEAGADAAADAGTDGAPADACQARIFFEDWDGDGFGNPSSTRRVASCDPPEGFVAKGGDCDDRCATCHPEAAEVCDGAIDEDCDDAIDEGCPCTDGAERSCGTNEGLCELGTQRCVRSVWGGSCEGGIKASEEICDGQDQSCSGTADDPFTDLGEPCTVGLGACRHEGTRVCSDDGSTTRCDADAGVPAATDTCNNDIDDDCDGKTDEPPASGCCDDGDCGSTERCQDAQCVPANATFCDLATRPSDVAPGDYTCLDFEDAGLPSGNGWTSETQANGSLAVATGSHDDSFAMEATVLPVAEGIDPADTAKLRWTAGGVGEVTSITFRARVHAPVLPTAHEGGSLSVFCLDNGLASYCVGMLPDAMVLAESLSDSAAAQACGSEGGSTLWPVEQWQPVELTVSTNGPPSLAIDGMPVALEEYAPGLGCGLTLPVAASAEVWFGLMTEPPTLEERTARYDDVEIIVRRQPGG